MEFVSVRDLRIRPGQVWDRLTKTGEVVITSNGKPIAILTGTTDEKFEQTLAALRRARAQVAVSRMRAAVKARGADRMTIDEIDAEISATRRERARTL